MKAVVFESKNRISVKTLPEPEACRGEVVVRIASSGICETDVWVYRSGAFARPGMVLGHMAGGEIVYVGVDVDGWRSGERVAIDPRVYCGQCLACRGGHATMCERRFAEGAGTWIGLDALRKAEEGELYLQSKTDTENVELKVVDRELLRRIEEMEETIGVLEDAASALGRPDGPGKLQ